MLFEGGILAENGDSLAKADGLAGQRQRDT